MTCNQKLFLFQIARSCPSLIYVPYRGAKQKWGGITRDPYKTFQKKLDRQTFQKNVKIPLKSEERAQKELLYPLNLNSLGQIISEYVPREKFSRAPLYTRSGWSQRWSGFKEGIQIIYGGAVIKRRLKKIKPFNPIEFARWAQDQFINTNVALHNKDKETLRQTTTESASEVYNLTIDGISTSRLKSLRAEFRNKQFMWEFVEEIERPRIVNARVAPLTTKDNLYGQVVVRLHTQQVLAVFDMARRLLRGHPSKPRKVIDYVVFERPLSLHDAHWRICGKLPPQMPYKKPNEVDRN